MRKRKGQEKSPERTGPSIAFRMKYKKQPKNSISSGAPKVKKNAEKSRLFGAFFYPNKDIKVRGDIEIVLEKSI